MEDGKIKVGDVFFLDARKDKDKHIFIVMHLMDEVIQVLRYVNYEVDVLFVEPYELYRMIFYKNLKDVQ